MTTFPHPLALVDLETTGGSPDQDRIIEIAILLYTPFSQEISFFSSLVNPKCPIPSRITKLTGITDVMVQEAPSFEELAPKILELTEGRVFMAHNVQFDYTFLKKSFRRMGILFQRKKFCTLKFAQKILPGLPGYGLDRLCEYFHIAVQNRHRALGDVQATWEVLQNLLKLDTQNVLTHFLSEGLSEHMIPESLSREALEALPDEPGVVWFLDKAKRALALYHSSDIRKKVFQLLREKHLVWRRQIAKIHFELTGSTLVAYLRKALEEERTPVLYGEAMTEPQQDHRVSHFYLVETPPKRGVCSLRIVHRVRKKDRLLLPFSSRQQARSFLRAFLYNFQLCGHYGGLTRSIPCGNFFSGSCRGICQDLESRTTYNQRHREAVRFLLDKPLFFALLDGGRTHDEVAFVLFRDLSPMGYGYLPQHLATQASLELCQQSLLEQIETPPRRFPQFLRKWFKTHKNAHLLSWNASGEQVPSHLNLWKNLLVSHTW